MQTAPWYTLTNTQDIITPCLAVYPDRIEENIKTMIAMAGGPHRLRPHIKTHKMGEIIQLQRKHGIDKFKCATIAEAELLGICGARDILLAMQPVGANVGRFFKLMEKYPESSFSTLVDNKDIAQQLADMAQKKGLKITLWLDLNNGMDRTGILPDQNAVALYTWMDQNPHIVPAGLHVYDGHIRDTELTDREQHCNHDFEPVMRLKESLEADGISVPLIVAGGSPTFPIHAKREGVETSPGTTLLWDAGYGSSFKDMLFLPAAVLLTRIVSKPTEDLVCFDLGHKWIAPEMNFPRVTFLEGEDWEQISQSEEHLVVRGVGKTWRMGDLTYALPRHICPTVAKYNTVTTVMDHTVTGEWGVVARDRKITI